jgi:hypothetical protein
MPFIKKMPAIEHFEVVLMFKTVKTPPTVKSPSPTLVSFELKRTVVATRKDLFGCPGESPWLTWRFAVGQENQTKDVRFLFSPLTTPPKREYNAVSSIADEI